MPLPKKFTHFLICPVFGALLLGSGCSSEDNEDIVLRDRPVDQGSLGEEPTTLSGQVMNHYLQNATVWLDINGNYLLDANEPATQSGEQGTFAFSPEQLTDGSSPRAYPLVAHILPGITLEASNIEGEAATVAEKGYLLTAPPGSRVISPLTTLVQTETMFLRETDPEASYGDGHNAARERLGTTLNLLGDYWKNDEPTLQAYAQAMSCQLEEMLSDSQQAVTGDGTLEFASTATSQLLTRSLLQRSARTAQAIDGIFSVDGSALGPCSEPLATPDPDTDDAVDLAAYATALNEMQAFQVDTTNPLLLTEKTWYSSANTTSVMLEDQFANELQTFAILEDPSPQAALLDVAEGEAPITVDAWTSNTKMIGQVTHNYLSNANLDKVRVDGGVDSYPTLSLSGVPDAVSEINLFETEVLRADGDADMTYALVQGDASDIDPRFSFAFNETPALTQLSSLLEPGGAGVILDTTNETYTLQKGSNSPDIFIYRKRISYDATGKISRIDFDGEKLSKVSLYCYDGETLASIREFILPFGDSTVDCATAAPNSETRFFTSTSGLPVACQTHQDFAGKVLCSLTLPVREDGYQFILTREFTSEPDSSISLNDGNLVMVERRVYKTLHELLELATDNPFGDIPDPTPPDPEDPALVLEED